MLVGCIMAWGLMKTLGARRRIVTTWLYIEVALMFGSGILGLGHHYFWIGTPEYWLGLGGFFSALEPIPLVAMVVHAGYEQAFVERAVGGSTWGAFFDGQTRPWFVQSMQWRMIFGVLMTAGLAILFWDLLTIGRDETRPAKQVPDPESESAAAA